MKPIKDHITPLNPRMKPPSVPPESDAAEKAKANPALSLKANGTEYTDSVMERLWTRMTEAYGSTWTRQYGLAYEGAFQTWKKALLSLTAIEISNGFDRAIDRHPEYPPKLGQFRELCQWPPEVTPAAHRVVPGLKGLPKPKPDYGRVRPYVQTLKTKLGIDPDKAAEKAEPFQSDPARRASLQAEMDKLLQTPEAK